MSELDLRLNTRWLERIFEQMRAHYGAAFDRQWEAPAGSDAARVLEAMRDRWSVKLAGFERYPEAIKYALDNLPSYPPNLTTFLELCNRAPEPAVLALPSPPADPERVAAALGALSAKRPDGYDDGKNWARRLRDKEQSGYKLNKAQRDFWRQALQSNLVL